jgi:hypothetical protein
MINWVKSENSEDKITGEQRVLAICDICNKEYFIKFRSYNVNVKNNSKFICVKCSNERLKEKMKSIWSNEEYRRNISEKMKSAWSDEEYRKNASEKLKIINKNNQNLKSDISKKLWQNEEYRNNQINKHIGKKTSDETKKTLSGISKKLWQNDKEELFVKLAFDKKQSCFIWSLARKIEGPSKKGRFGRRQLIIINAHTGQIIDNTKYYLTRYKSSYQ